MDHQDISLRVVKKHFKQKGGAKPEIKRNIIKMKVNGSGIKDISIVLEIIKDTVMKTLKNRKKLNNVNLKYINLEKALNIRIEMDEMCEQVKSKKESCLLWHVIYHYNFNVIGSREHYMLWKLTDILYNLNPNIISVYSHNNFTYHIVMFLKLVRKTLKKLRENI